MTRWLSVLGLRCPAVGPSQLRDFADPLDFHPRRLIVGEQFERVASLFGYRHQRLVAIDPALRIPLQAPTHAVQREPMFEDASVFRKNLPGVLRIERPCRLDSEAGPAVAPIFQAQHAALQRMDVLHGKARGKEEQDRGEPGQRSEEHTSNSSHGYISYAVFCLKKKKKKR